MNARLRFASAGRELADVKRACYDSYVRAKKSGGGIAPAIIDKLWADTLLAVERQPAETAAEMYRRAQHLFVLVEDRARWIGRPL